MSTITCQLPLTQTATGTDPLPANSITMHSRLVWEDPKTPPKKSKANAIVETLNKIYYSKTKLVVRSSTKRLQFTGKRGFQGGDKQTTDGHRDL